MHLYAIDNGPTFSTNVHVPAALETCLESSRNSQDVYPTFMGKHDA